MHLKLGQADNSSRMYARFFNKIKTKKVVGCEHKVTSGHHVPQKEVTKRQTEIRSLLNIWFQPYFCEIPYFFKLFFF